ncbi:MAG TPA: Rad52/Rad22 family DNA repair protein [Ktedonobacterales bacterium]|nr:Rad52/Rad22 family DNA repair protein [Ktedonobacterales bacterium]
MGAPFAPEGVEWRPQGKTAPGARVQLVAYVDARTVMERLDAVVGVGGWSFALEPIVLDAAELRVARGRRTIGGVSRDDVGTASNWEPSNGCASDALKRAAVLWGIGRYLYALPAVHVTLDERGQVSESMLAKLRDGLARRARDGPRRTSA